MTEDQVAMIPLHNIKPSEVALRSVDRDSEKYLELVESIRTHGVLNAICVTDLGDGVYGLVDGLHRTTAAKDAGKTTIPALIKNLEEAQLMEAQIITNLHKVETKPIEYTRQLMRLCAADPLLTMRDLATKLSVSDTWLSNRLSLVDLASDIQELVSEDKITLVNAYSLAKLPVEEQPEYVDRAMTDPPTTFVPLISQRIKEIKDAHKQGKEAAPAEFAPIARLQSVAAVRDERDSFANGPRVLQETNATTAAEGWQAAINWALSLDPQGVNEQREKYEQRKRLREEKKEKAKQERERRKQEEAAAAAADITNL